MCIPVISVCDTSKTLLTGRIPNLQFHFGLIHRDDFILKIKSVSLKQDLLVSKESNLKSYKVFLLKIERPDFVDFVYVLHTENFVSVRGTRDVI